MLQCRQADGLVSLWPWTFTPKQKICLLAVSPVGRRWGVATGEAFCDTDSPLRLLLEEVQGGTFLLEMIDNLNQ